MKILNLYAGIGGNRKLWGEGHDITAVEFDKDIANLYKKFYPNDNVIVGDAHKYLLDHYKEFDFIWSSPPCPSHSRIRYIGALSDKSPHQKPIYAEMSLYQEIIFLKHFAQKNIKWCVENVKPYYKALIEGKEFERHLFWTNFDITYRDFPDKRVHSNIHGGSVVYGFDLKNENIKDKRKILRNMVNPEIGLHIINESIGVKTVKKREQQNLF